MRNGGAGGDAIKHLEVGWEWWFWWWFSPEEMMVGRMRFGRKEWSRNGDFV
jgi:hypothetical protein